MIAQPVGQSITVRRLEAAEDLEAIRACWEGWQNHPNSDWAHFQLVCRLRPEIQRPEIFVVDRHGQPGALLVARLERTHVPARIGYLEPARIPATVLNVLNQGVLGDLDDASADALVAHLWKRLAAGRADAVVFHHLSEDSALVRALLQRGPRWWLERRPVWATHRAMGLRHESGFLLKNMQSKGRKQIRKRASELDAAFPGRVTWRWLTEFDDVARRCAELEPVAAKTYQRALGAGFVADEEHRQRFALFADRGQLRIELLEIDGEIRAFWVGVVYDGTFHSWTTGYDPDLKKYQVGTLMFLRMVDELVQEGVEQLDFGLGDAFYKQRFGDREWREATLRMFAPTAKGLLLRSALGFCSAVDLAGKRVLEKVGGLNRIRTSWRRHLISGQETPAESQP